MARYPLAQADPLRAMSLLMQREQFNEEMKRRDLAERSASERMPRGNMPGSITGIAQNTIQQGVQPTFSTHDIDFGARNYAGVGYDMAAANAGESVTGKDVMNFIGQQNAFSTRGLPSPQAMPDQGMVDAKTNLMNEQARAVRGDRSGTISDFMKQQYQKDLIDQQNRVADERSATDYNRDTIAAKNKAEEGMLQQQERNDGAIAEGIIKADPAYVTEEQKKWLADYLARPKGIVNSSGADSAANTPIAQEQPGWGTIKKQDGTIYDVNTGKPIVGGGVYTNYQSQASPDIMTQVQQAVSAGLLNPSDKYARMSPEELQNILAMARANAR